MMSRLKKKIENGLLSAINWSKLMVLQSSSRLLRKKVIASWQPVPVKGPKMLKALTDAMTYNANIRINYRNSGWRTILPYGWNTSREGNILVMCYKDTGEIRSYRLDRIYDLLVEDNLSDHHDDMLTWEDFQMPTLPNIDEIIEETEAEIDNEPLPYDAGLKALTTNQVDNNIINKEEQYKDGEDLSDVDLSINEEPSDNNDVEEDSSTNASEESNDNTEENVEIDSDESTDKSTSSDNESEQPIENNSNEETNMNFDDVISSLEEESNNEEK